MLKEFFVEGRIAFHLGMLQNGKKNGWDVITNVPKEILERNEREVRQLAIKVQAFKMSQHDYINELAEIIKRDRLSEHFYYPEFIYRNSKQLPSEIFEYLYKVIEGFVLEPLSFFSEYYEPVKFYVLLQKYYRLKFFYPADFKIIIPCSKQQFEQNIPDVDAAGEYFDLYSDDNKHFYCQDDDSELYILLKEERPCMIMIG
jgi:hypothetical protein